MLNYNEIKKRIMDKEMTVSTFCEKLKFTRPGLQKSLDNGMLPVNKLFELCELLEITPNQFMEWDDVEPVQYVAEEGLYCKAPKSSGIKEISLLSKQLAVKDKEIDRLLRILESQNGIPCKKEAV